VHQGRRDCCVVTSCVGSLEKQKPPLLIGWRFLICKLKSFFCKPVSVSLKRTQERAIIPLAATLLPRSSNLPGSRTRRAASSPLFGLAPCGVFPARLDYSSCGALLPHLFTLTPRLSSVKRYIFCGTIRKIHFERTPPAVSRHTALWRPDFPPACTLRRKPAIARRKTI
jgi:hypothetical protein